MKSRLTHVVLGAGLMGIALAVGCRPKEAAPPPPVAIPIPAGHPVSREVTDYVDFTGRTQAIRSVNVVARVTGYLVEEPFKEGAERQEGRPALRDRSAALSGPIRSGRGTGQSLQGTTQPCPNHAGPRRATRSHDAGRGQRPADRSGPRRHRRGRGPGQGLRGQPGHLPAEPRFLPGDLPDRRPGEPLLPYPRQPR